MLVIVRGECSCGIGFRDDGLLATSCGQIVSAPTASVDDTCPSATPSPSVLMHGTQSRVAFANAQARACSLYLSDRGLLSTTCAVNFPTRDASDTAAATTETDQPSPRGVRVVGPQALIEFTNAHAQTCTMAFTSSHTLETTCPWAWVGDETKWMRASCHV